MCLPPPCHCNRSEINLPKRKNSLFGLTVLQVSGQSQFTPLLCGIVYCSRCMRGGRLFTWYTIKEQKTGILQSPLGACLQSPSFFSLASSSLTNNTTQLETRPAAEALQRHFRVGLQQPYSLSAPSPYFTTGTYAPFQILWTLATHQIRCLDVFFYA